MTRHNAANGRNMKNLRMTIKHPVVSADTWPELSLQIQLALEMAIEGVIATTPKGDAK